MSWLNGHTQHNILCFTFNVALSIVMLNVTLLSVIMLDVVNTALNFFVGYELAQ